MISRAFLYPLIAILLAPGFGSAAEAASGEFCIQTFNVYGPAYASGVEYRLSRLAEELVKDHCAATQFQEFWRQSDYQQFSHELDSARLAILFADDIRQDGIMIGLASAFTGNIHSARSELFTANNESGVLDWARDFSGVQKGFTLLDVKLDNSSQFLFANVHTHPTEEAIRVAQMAQLVLKLWQDPLALERPLVLNGDLNAVPGGPEMDLLQNALLLRDTFLEANGAYGKTCTYCASNPLSWSWSDRVIDFVLVRNSPALTLTTKTSEVNLRGEAGNPLSDHFGVRSQLAWEERAPRLLAVGDDIVQQRIFLALAALSRAEKILGAWDSDASLMIAAELNGKIAALREGHIPSFFLVP